MEILKPSFRLIGSIVEGSRIGQADELDIMLFFKGLTEKERGFSVFEKLGSAYHLDLTQEGLKFFKEKNLGWLIKGEKQLNYIVLLQFLIREVKKVGKELKKLFPKLKFNLDYSVKNKCKACCALRKRKKEQQFQHCLDPECLPFLSVTKRGLCLIVRNEDKNGAISTIDLCPVLEVMDKNVIDPLNLTIESLLRDKPPYALKILTKMFGIDRILPEWFDKERKGGEKPIVVGMKFLNFGPGEDCILVKPGQVLQVQQLQDYPNLLRSYCIIKAFKDALGVGLKSYMLKKLLLREEIKQSSETSNSNAIVRRLMSLNGIKEHFEELIDFEEWEKLDNEWDSNNAGFLTFAPLTPKGREKIQSLKKK